MVTIGYPHPTRGDHCLVGLVNSLAAGARTLLGYFVSGDGIGVSDT